MSALAETIQYVSARETEKAEAILAATLRNLQDDFAAWCTEHGTIAGVNPSSLQSFTQFCLANKVPYLPCRPTTLAAFIQSQIADGIKPEKIRSIVSAIESLHDQNGYGNPAATSLVRFALDRMAPIEPPRSWTASEKILFTVLPAEIQSVINRREANRETSLRNKQNQLAEELKKAKRQTEDSAETKPVELKEEITANG